jgi:hypothetical protein
MDLFTSPLEDEEMSLRELAMPSMEDIEVQKSDLALATTWLLRMRGAYLWTCSTVTCRVGSTDPSCFVLAEVRTLTFPFSSAVTILTEKPTMF